MVFQRPVLLRRSSLANVMYGLSVQGVGRRAAGRQAMDALQRFGLTALAHRPARALSGGEQQRLALARAWALRPEVLFLDEPTAALDPAAVKAVEAFHADGTRIVMSTHDLGHARRLGGMNAGADGGFIVVASTTSTEHSGLFTHLLPKFREATGIQVRILAVVSGPWAVPGIASLAAVWDRR